MGLVREVVLWCHLFAIFWGIAGLTITFLAGRKHTTKLNKSLKLFLLGVLAISLYDLWLHYGVYIIGRVESMLAIRVGTCIMAILFFLWLNLAEKIADTDAFGVFQKAAGRYMLIYAVLWFCSAIVLSVRFFHVLRGLLLVTDITLLFIMLVGSVVYTSKAVLQCRSRWVVYFMILVTAMLTWNYLFYFWTETSVYWGDGRVIRESADLTILFSFAVNIAAVFFAYAYDFRAAYGEAEEKSDFDLEKAMADAASEYDLTARERVLCSLICQGKSNSQIAESLFISESTVKTHVYNIFRKLHVKNRVGVTCVLRGEKLQEAAPDNKYRTSI